MNGDDNAVSRRSRIGGGVLGIVAALVMIPAYIVGSPEAPDTADAAAQYYELASGFVLANGIVPLAHVVAFLLFLAVLTAAVGSGRGGAFTPRFAVLGGGVAFIALTSAGFVAEILYPATLMRFPDAAFDPLVSLTMAIWLYHFAQAAGAVMMIGVAAASLRGGPFPAWFGVLSLVFAVLALLHTWIGVWSAYTGLLWIVLAGLLLILKRDEVQR